MNNGKKTILFDERKISNKMETIILCFWLCLAHKGNALKYAAVSTKQQGMEVINEKN